MIRGRLDEAQACFERALAVDASFQTSADNLVKIAIMRQGERFERAVEQGDADALAALYTQGGVLLPPNEEAVKGRDAIRDYWAGFLADGGFAIDVETVEVYVAGDTATEIAVWTLKQGGEEIDSGRAMVVWGRVGTETLLTRVLRCRLA